MDQITDTENPKQDTVRLNKESKKAKRLTERRKLLSSLSNILAFSSAVVASIGALYGWIDVKKDRDRADLTFVKSVVTEFTISDLQKDVGKLKQDMDALKKAKQPGSPDLAFLSGKVQGIETRMSKLEDVILRNPAKAIEVPLLQRDLNNLTATERADVVSVRTQVDHDYDIMKFVLGGTLLATFSGAASNLFSRKKEG